MTFKDPERKRIWQQEYMCKRRMSMKIKCIEYKGGKCIKCGYKKCISALHFHHKNRHNKLFDISKRLTKTWEHLKDELDKCDLLCANCHHEVEYESRYMY